MGGELIRGWGGRGLVGGESSKGWIHWRWKGMWWKMDLQEATSVEVLFGAESPDDTDVL